MIEGVILAGLITEATEGFIYIRHEYHEQIEACRQGDRAGQKTRDMRDRTQSCWAGRFRFRCSSAPADISAASKAR